MKPVLTRAGSGMVAGLVATPKLGGARARSGRGQRTQRLRDGHEIRERVGKLGMVLGIEGVRAANDAVERRAGDAGEEQRQYVTEHGLPSARANVPLERTNERHERWRGANRRFHVARRAGSFGAQRTEALSMGGSERAQARVVRTESREGRERHRLVVR